MPELPEVESVRRQLQPELRGRRVVKIWTDVQRRFHHPELLEGHTVMEVGRRGKFLICPLDGGLELVLHLGMTGVLHFGPADPWSRARIGLDDGRELVFRDVRRFGTLAVVRAGVYEALPTLAHLGPEPLSEAFDPVRFAIALAATRSPVKPYLLTQRAVAGVGNIYADEALWLARIHPASRHVGRRRAFDLHAAIREVLEQAIAREGTTFRDYRMVNGASGRNGTFLIAYGQAGRPCPRCQAPLRKMVLGGRGTTFCPNCQRR
jgi:formamidopyrimidine-DNA glycosylase